MSERTYHVLMVEDNPNHYKILVRFINKSGLQIEVDHVASAHEFFNVFLAKNYDLLMLDYNLAQFTGLSILKKLNDIEVTTPIIMVTQQKDPEIAISAMKLGAVDFIIKSKENFQLLPEKIIEYITGYENEVATSEVFKIKRQSLLRNPEVHKLIQYMMTAKKLDVESRSETLFGFSPGQDEVKIDNASLEKVLNLLTVNRVMVKKPVGVKIACPRCESDNINTVPVCPHCGGKVFVKNAVKTDDEEPLRCLSGCGKTFSEVQVNYKCNECYKEFDQYESKYRHIYHFTVNTQMMEELKQGITSNDEVKLWEEKNKVYTQNIENTKQMHEEIRTQLRALVEQQIKNK